MRTSFPVSLLLTLVWHSICLLDLCYCPPLSALSLHEALAEPVVLWSEQRRKLA